MGCEKVIASNTPEKEGITQEKLKPEDRKSKCSSLVFSSGSSDLARFETNFEEETTSNTPVCI